MSDLTPGRNYTLTIQGGLQSSNLFSMIGIDFRDGNGNETGELARVITTNFPGQQTINFTAPASFNSATLWVWVPATGNNQKLWLNGLSIR